jgi:voltage-gated potassium channel
MEGMRRLRWAATGLLAVVVVGTAGYVALGFGALDALYQTVTTISTVGFREIEPLDSTGQVFTIVLILVGVGFALYTFGVLLEVLVEGRLTKAGRRRLMDRRLAQLEGHVIVCGWGRVGRAFAHYATGGGETVVVVDRDEERLEGLDLLHVVGDASDDDVLRAAGIERARALVAGLDTDADNLYLTLSGRALNPSLFIVARARDETSDAKLRRAGADRVVNPQAIGGARIAGFILQPHVAEFLDMVVHDGSQEFSLGQVAITPGSPFVGRTLADAEIRSRTGALILAVRDAAGRFEPNPGTGNVLRAGDVLIAVGTGPQLEALAGVVTVPGSPPAAAC